MPKKLTARAIGLTLTGAVIGAGFASGQEIQHFFMNYGRMAVGGAVVTILVFIAFSGWLATYCKRQQLKTLTELLIRLAGERVGGSFLHLLNLFMWFGLTVMLAGSATLLTEVCRLPRPTGALLTAMLVYLVCRGQVASLAAANELLLPLLLFLMFFFLLRSTGTPRASTLVVATDSRWWFWSALLYMGSNSAILLAIMAPLIAEAADSRSIWQGVLLAAGLLLCLLLAIIFLLSKYADICSLGDMPMLYISRYLLPNLPWLYGVLLFIALITTAFANALSISKYLQQTLPKAANFALLVVILAASYVAQRGFGRLVATLYPLTGYFCLAFYGISCLHQIRSFDRH